jgi:hypothetical protein
MAQYSASSRYFLNMCLLMCLSDAVGSGLNQRNGVVFQVYKFISIYFLIKYYIKKIRQIDANFILDLNKI